MKYGSGFPAIQWLGNKASSDVFSSFVIFVMALLGMISWGWCPVLASIRMSVSIYDAVIEKHTFSASQKPFTLKSVYKAGILFAGSTSRKTGSTSTTFINHFISIRHLPFAHLKSLLFIHSYKFITLFLFTQTYIHLDFPVTSINILIVYSKKLHV